MSTYLDASFAFAPNWFIILVSVLALVGKSPPDAFANKILARV
jgi:hypothetical protein